MLFMQIDTTFSQLACVGGGGGKEKEEEGR